MTPVHPNDFVRTCPVDGRPLVPLAITGPEQHFRCPVCQLTQVEPLGPLSQKLGAAWNTAIDMASGVDLDRLGAAVGISRGTHGTDKRLREVLDAHLSADEKEKLSRMILDLQAERQNLSRKSLWDAVGTPQSRKAPAPPPLTEEEQLAKRVREKTVAQWGGSK